MYKKNINEYFITQAFLSLKIINCKYRCDEKMNEKLQNINLIYNIYNVVTQMR